MNQSVETCQNCEKQHKVGFEFCPHCGQTTKDELTLGLLFYNTISNYFSIDARFFKSFIPLMLKPGYLGKRFIEGKRLLYLHPAQLYLFISVVFFFLFSFSVRKEAQEWNKNLAKTLIKETDTITNQRVKDSLKLVKLLDTNRNDSIAKATTKKALMGTSKFTRMTESEIDSIVNSENLVIEGDNGLNFGFNEEVMDSLIAINAPEDQVYKQMGMSDDPGYLEKKLFVQLLKFYKTRQGGSVLQTFYDTLPIAMFFLLPIFALILKIFYLKRGRYSHHLVFSFYYFSFLFAVFSIIIGMNMIWDIPDGFDWFLAVSTIFYLFIALRTFYEQKWFLTFIKTGFVSFLFLLFVLPLTAGILALFAFMFY
jgi:hypothetical protein